MSPDGRYILDCNNGLRIYEFKIEKQGDQDKIVLEEQRWQLPIMTEGIELVELAKHVKFESSHVIRFLTWDDRDILFEFSLDDKVKYLSVVEV